MKKVDLKFLRPFKDSINKWRGNFRATPKFLLLLVGAELLIVTGMAMPKILTVNYYMSQGVSYEVAQTFADDPETAKSVLGVQTQSFNDLSNVNSFVPFEPLSKFLPMIPTTVEVGKFGINQGMLVNNLNDGGNAGFWRKLKQDGVSYTLGIAMSPSDAGSAGAFVKTAHEYGIIPIVRLCYNGACGFNADIKDPKAIDKLGDALGQFGIDTFNASGGNYFIYLPSPNEPLTEAPYWLSGFTVGKPVPDSDWTALARMANRALDYIKTYAADGGKAAGGIRVGLGAFNVGNATQGTEAPLLEKTLKYPDGRCRNWDLFTANSYNQEGADTDTGMRLSVPFFRGFGVFGKGDAAVNLRAEKGGTIALADAAKSCGKTVIFTEAGFIYDQQKGVNNSSQEMMLAANGTTRRTKLIEPLKDELDVLYDNDLVEAVLFYRPYGRVNGRFWWNSKLDDGAYISQSTVIRDDEMRYLTSWQGGDSNHNNKYKACTYDVKYEPRSIVKIADFTPVDQKVSKDNQVSLRLQCTGAQDSLKCKAEAVNTVEIWTPTKIIASNNPVGTVRNKDLSICGMAEIFANLISKQSDGKGPMVLNLADSAPVPAKLGSTTYPIPGLESARNCSEMLKELAAIDPNLIKDYYLHNATPNVSKANDYLQTYGADGTGKNSTFNLSPTRGGGPDAPDYQTVSVLFNKNGEADDEPLRFYSAHPFLLDYVFRNYYDLNNVFNLDYAPMVKVSDNFKSRAEASVDVAAENMCTDFGNVIKVGDSISFNPNYLPGSANVAMNGASTKTLLGLDADSKVNPEKVDLAARYTNALNSNAKAAVIMLGTNDCGGIPVAEFSGYLERIIKDFAGRGKKIILSTIPVRRADCAMGRDNYNQAISAIALKYGLLRNIDDSFKLSDLEPTDSSGLHFKDTSYPKVNNQTYDLLKQLIGNDACKAPVSTADKSEVLGSSTTGNNSSADSPVSLPVQPGSGSASPTYGSTSAFTSTNPAAAKVELGVMNNDLLIPGPEKKVSEISQKWPTDGYVCWDAIHGRLNNEVLIQVIKGDDVRDICNWVRKPSCDFSSYTDLLRARANPTTTINKKRLANLQRETCYQQKAGTDFNSKFLSADFASAQLDNQSLEIPGLGDIAANLTRLVNKLVEQYLPHGVERLVMFDYPRMGYPLELYLRTRDTSRAANGIMDKSHNEGFYFESADCKLPDGKDSYIDKTEYHLAAGMHTQKFVTFSAEFYYIERMLNLLTYLLTSGGTATDALINEKDPSKVTDAQIQDYLTNISKEQTKEVQAKCYDSVGARIHPAIIAYAKQNNIDLAKLNLFEFYDCLIGWKGNDVCKQNPWMGYICSLGNGAYNDGRYIDCSACNLCSGGPTSFTSSTNVTCPAQQAICTQGSGETNPAHSHQGLNAIDLAGGTHNIVAPFDGTIVDIKSGDQYTECPGINAGGAVWFKSDQKINGRIITLKLYHLKVDGVSLRIGQHFTTGITITTMADRTEVANSTCWTGPHLHMEVVDNNDLNKVLPESELSVMNLADEFDCNISKERDPSCFVPRPEETKKPVTLENPPGGIADVGNQCYCPTPAGNADTSLVGKFEGVTCPIQDPVNFCFQGPTGASTHCQAMEQGNYPLDLFPSTKTEPRNMNVVAPEDGEIVTSQKNTGVVGVNLGMTVEIKGKSTILYSFTHLENPLPKGTQVTVGQVIGQICNNCFAQGQQHTHVAAYTGSDYRTAIDPYLLYGEILGCHVKRPDPGMVAKVTKVSDEYCRYGDLEQNGPYATTLNDGACTKSLPMENQADTIKKFTPKQGATPEQPPANQQTFMAPADPTKPQQSDHNTYLQSSSFNPTSMITALYPSTVATASNSAETDNMSPVDQGKVLGTQKAAPAGNCSYSTCPLTPLNGVAYPGCPDYKYTLCDNADELNKIFGNGLPVAYPASETCDQIAQTVGAGVRPNLGGFNFLGRPFTVNKKIIPYLQKVVADIMAEGAVDLGPVQTFACTKTVNGVKVPACPVTREKWRFPSGEYEIEADGAFNARGIRGYQDQTDQICKDHPEDTSCNMGLECRSPFNRISNHSWGTALDIDAGSNAMGSCNIDMPPEIVYAFEKNGFRWGGRYGRPDGMHFEYCADGNFTYNQPAPVNGDNGYCAVPNGELTSVGGGAGGDLTVEKILNVCSPKITTYIDITPEQVYADYAKVSDYFTPDHDGEKPAKLARIREILDTAKRQNINPGFLLAPWYTEGGARGDNVAGGTGAVGFDFGCGLRADCGIARRGNGTTPSQTETDAGFTRSLACAAKSDRLCSATENLQQFPACAKADKIACNLYCSYQNIGKDTPISISGYGEQKAGLGGFLQCYGPYNPQVSKSTNQYFARTWIRIYDAMFPPESPAGRKQDGKCSMSI